MSECVDHIANTNNSTDNSIDNSTDNNITDNIANNSIDNSIHNSIDSSIHNSIDNNIHNISDNITNNTSDNSIHNSIHNSINNSIDNIINTSTDNIINNNTSDNNIHITLASYGIFGRVLSDVPEDIINMAGQAGIGEIVDKDVVEQLKTGKWSTDKLGISISEYISEPTGSKSDLVIRLKTQEWREFVLGNNFKDSKPIFLFSSLIFCSPDGFLSSQAKNELVIPGERNRLNEWVKKLREKDLISVETVESDILYKYNYEKFNENIKNKNNNENIKNKNNENIKNKNTSNGNNNSIGNIKRFKNNSNSLNLSISDVPINGISENINNLFPNLEDIKSFIDSRTEIFKLDTLIDKCNINDNLIDNSNNLNINDSNDSIDNNAICNKLISYQKIFNCRIFKDIDGSYYVINKNITTEQIDEIIIKTFEKEKVVLLSEQIDRIIQIKPSAFTGGIAKFLAFLENMGFFVVEITSKFISAEYIIFKDKESTENMLLYEHLLEKAKLKIGEAFKNKLKQTFYKNTFFSYFDNGYISALKVRVRTFYNYILRNIGENVLKDGKGFVFDQNALMKMEMNVFLTLIPLKYENLVPELVNSIIDNYKNNSNDENIAMDNAVMDSLDNIVDNSNIIKDYLKNDELVSFDDVYSICSKLFNVLTVGDVMKYIGNESQAEIYFKSKVTIKEFEKIFRAIVKFNIFESFENEDYIYFELIEGVEDYLEHIFDKITNDAADVPSTQIPHSLRKDIFDKLLELSQEDFIIKAKEIVTNDIKDIPVKKYYLRKLSSFN